MKKQPENGSQPVLTINRKADMEPVDETTETVRQSIITAKGKKHCLKDFSGDVFELTSEMLVAKGGLDKKQIKELSKTAECILQKYAKLLSVSK